MRPVNVRRLSPRRRHTARAGYVSCRPMHISGSVRSPDDHPGPDHLPGVVELANGCAVSSRWAPSRPATCRRGLLGRRGGDGGRLSWPRARRPGRRMGGRQRSRGTHRRGPRHCAPGGAPPCPARGLAAVHPTNFAASYHGLEVLLGLALSSVNRRRVALPIPDNGGDILQRLDEALTGTENDRGPCAAQRGDLA